jgi:DNA-binding transcriptional ArsR family regulator
VTRDMDLVRELLLKLESLPVRPGEVFLFSGHDPEIAIDGYSADQITYHLDLLREAGLIESPGSQPMLGVTFERLSWRGHDFLDSVRNPETWKKTKEGARKIGSWSVDLLLSIAKAYGTRLAKEKLGLDL